MTTTGTVPSDRRSLWWLWIIIAVLIILLIICFLTRKQPGRREKGVAQTLSLAPGCPANNQPSTTAELHACLQNLEFDTTETVGDEQRLMVRETGPGPRCIGDTTHACRYGPLAKVEPVKHSHMFSDSALGEGRIIARIFLRAGETDSYPKLGLVPGETTYWWVHTGKDSSYFVHPVPHNMNLVAVGRPLTQTAHEPGTFQQGLVRWIWDSTDERLNGTCGSSCCKP